MKSIITMGILIRSCLLSSSLSLAAISFRVVPKTPNALRYEAIAEAAYKRQSQFWFGKPHPPLWDTVEITVREGRLGAGGVTSFSFDRAQTFGWKMTVQGTPERIADSVIPHEVNHIVFAAHFRRPLPRAFDEGAATLFEHDIEKARLRQFLTGRLPAVRDVMDRTEYPKDQKLVGPFYAVGFAITEYLAETYGRAKFIAFLSDRHKPSEALLHHYSLTPEELDRRWQVRNSRTSAMNASH